MFSQKKLSVNHSASPWMIIGISVVLVGVVVIQAVLNYNREEEYMGQILAEKGSALIRSFEAASRTGMMGMMGNGMYGGGMYGNGYSQSGYNNGAYQTFINDTQALRSSISADRAELNALMAGTNPDPQKARALSEKISKSENELRTKAQQYNVAPGMGS